MTLEREGTAQIVEAWLSTTVDPEEPDAVLDRVIARLDATPQRRVSWPMWRFADLNTFAKLGVAAAAVAAVVLLASSYAATQGVGTGPPEPSLTSEPSPSSTPMPILDFGPDSVPLAAGRHVITDVEPFQLTITLPSEGWHAKNHRPTHWSAARADGGVIGFTTADPPYCAEVDPPADPTITVDGFVGERLDSSIFGDACHPNFVLDALGADWGRGPNNLLTLWVLDVDGEELVMYAWTVGASSDPSAQAQHDELLQLVGSVEIAVPNFGPDSAPMAAGTHVITDVEPFQLTITLSEGWHAISGRPTHWSAMRADGGVIGFTTTDPPACAADLPANPTTTVDGFVGERADISIFSDVCHANVVLDALGADWGRGPRNLLTLWVVDVDGQELVLYAWNGWDRAQNVDDARPEHAELSLIAQSVQIEVP